MTVINEDLTANADDGREYFGFFSVDYPGIVQGLYYGSYLTYAGWRFQTIAVPQGATINSATLTPTLRNFNSPSGWNIGRLFGYDTDDAAPWTVGFSGVVPSEIAKTTAFTSLASFTGTGGSPVAIDVTAIVQEIVDRGGWASGNDMSFFGGVTGATAAAWFYDYRDDAAKAATLEIDYTEGGPAAVEGTGAGTTPAVTGSATAEYDGVTAVGFVDFDSASQGSTGYSPVQLTVPFPAGATTGDLLLLAFAADENNDYQTVPAGWTSLVNYTPGGSGATSYRAIFAYRFLDGTEGGSVTLTGSTARRCQGVVGAFRGVDPSTPIQPPGTRTDSSGTSVAVTGLTVAENGSMLVGLTVSGNGGESYTWPGGWSRIYNNDEAPGGTGQSTVSLGLAVQLADAGAVAGFNVTASASSSHTTFLLALAPVPAEEDVEGTGAGTAPAAAGSATAAHGVAGSGAGTASAPTGAASGLAAVIGAGAATAPAATGAASGVHGVAGTAEGVTGSVTGQASGVHGVAGSGAGAVPAAAGQGGAVHGVVAAAEGTTPAAAGAATAVHGVAGSAAGTVAVATGSAAGVHGVAGAGQGSTAAVTGSAAGAHGVAGTGAGTTPPATGEAEADLGAAVEGTGDGTTPPATGSGTALTLVVGAGAGTTPAAVGSGSAEVDGGEEPTVPSTGGGGGFAIPIRPRRKKKPAAVEGLGAGIVPAPYGQAAAVHGVSAVGAGVLRPVIGRARGEVPVTGAGTGVAPAVSGAAHARHDHFGDDDIALIAAALAA